MVIARSEIESKVTEVLESALGADAEDITDRKSVV